MEDKYFDTKIEYTYNHCRRSYVDGTKTPLSRGLLHLLITLCMPLTLLTNICRNLVYQLNIIKLFSIGLIFSCYLCSTLLHCVRFPSNIEIIINIIDHYAIHNHIFACLLILFNESISFKLSCFYFVLNYVYDIYKACKGKYAYIFTLNHYIHYGISLLIVFINIVININNYNEHQKQLIYLSASFFIAGKIIYITTRNKLIQNKYWSYHETFHLLTSIGSVIVFCLIFDL